MEFDLSDGLKKSLVLVGASLLIIVATVGLKNLTVPDNTVEVGYTEVTTECLGLDAGVCIGLEKRDSTTYNYDNYTDPEPGTENYYRRVESELMLQAYSICDSSMSGMEWTDEASYDNKTATEWMENEQVDLLSCEKSFYRDLDATE